MIVLDCSLTAAWFLRDESNAGADEILPAVAAGTAVVPSLWISETASLLVVALRRGRLTLR